LTVFDELHIARRATFRHVGSWPIATHGSEAVVGRFRDTADNVSRPPGCFYDFTA
jgi:hypothetical protein